MAPFALLVDIVELIVRGDHDQCDQVNRLIDHIAELHTREFSARDWMEGIPDLEEDDEIMMTEGDEILAQFDMRKADAGQKQAFIQECVLAYRRTILKVDDNASPATVIWREFQLFVIKKLGIPKKHFKPIEWREHLENVIGSSAAEAMKGTMIAWRAAKR